MVLAFLVHLALSVAKTQLAQSLKKIVMVAVRSPVALIFVILVLVAGLQAVVVVAEAEAVANKYREFRKLKILEKITKFLPRIGKKVKTSKI